jgi:tRNA (Thr-GGU) A37 N-methylase
MTAAVSCSVHPIGFIRSALKRRDEAPRQGSEGAPDAWLEVSPGFVEGLQGMAVGQEIIIVTWFARIRIGPMEAIDGTPVADIKPVLLESTDS